MKSRSEHVARKVRDERRELLALVERWLEPPMTLLAFVWLALFIVDLAYGLSPLLNKATDAIWLVFLFDFGLKLMLAPEKWAYVRKNLLTVLALVIPAVRIFRLARVFRILRLARGIRGVRLLRFLTSLNRGMRALSRTLGKRGFGYVVLLTVIVIFTGAAGMYAFEHSVGQTPAVNDYGTAVWWTAMTITTMGTDYFPKSTEGRILCFILALYGFAVFGYITATVASFFIDREASDGEKRSPELQADIARLEAKIDALIRDKAA